MREHTSFTHGSLLMLVDSLETVVWNKLELFFGIGSFFLSFSHWFLGGSGVFPHSQVCQLRFSGNAIEWSHN